MIEAREVSVGASRIVHAYDTGPIGGEGPTLLWHHGGDRDPGRRPGGPDDHLGASGGGPPSLACGALLSDRVVAAVTLASIAPYTGDEVWFAGMASPGALRATLAGREARARHAETAEFDPAVFVDPDWAALAGCPRAELWLRPRDGHVSVLSALPIALGWLLAQSS